MKIKNILSALFLGIFLLAGMDTFAQKKTKSVEPLYWKNPLEFVYSELNSPKRMKMPKVVLDDTDGDGVADLDDRCPNAMGSIENKGCPEITKADVVRITYIGSKIFFENNSDKLKVASLSQLDELTKILQKYEGASLTIEGHTDSVGTAAYNETLSQKRSNSVKFYLIEKGISEGRLTALGYGESKPIASNKSALGKAKNRRVELKTNY